MPRGPGFIIAFAAALFLGFGSARADDPKAEDVVKATFVYRFASFVVWPESAFTAPEAAIRVCVLGAPTMRAVLEGVVRNQTSSGRPFTVRAVSGIADAQHCHILYAAASVSAESLRQLQHLPILTITDATYGAGARGIVHFAIVDHRVRFHIDDASAAENNLSISSRLLSLALSVRRRVGA